MYEMHLMSLITLARCCLFSCLHSSPSQPAKSVQFSHLGQTVACPSGPSWLLLYSQAGWPRVWSLWAVYYFCIRWNVTLKDVAFKQPSVGNIRELIPSGEHFGASQMMLVVKNLPANAGDVRDTVRSLGWEDSPGEGNCNPLQCSYLEDPHGQSSLAGCSPRSRKELDTTEVTEPAASMRDIWLIERGNERELGKYIIFPSCLLWTVLSHDFLTLSGDIPHGWADVLPEAPARALCRGWWST